MPKEYRTIQEVAGPLMMVHGVENVTYNELHQPGKQQSALFRPLHGAGRKRGYAGPRV